MKRMLDFLLSRNVPVVLLLLCQFKLPFVFTSFSPHYVRSFISSASLFFFFSLQNPDIVLVHYLNVPAIEDCGKPCGPILCSINTDKKEWAKWTKEELIGQLKPMCECQTTVSYAWCRHDIQTSTYLFTIYSCSFQRRFICIYSGPEHFRHLIHT